MIVDVKPLFSELSPDGELGRTYTSRWRVKTNEKFDGPIVVANAPELPPIGSHYQWGHSVDLGAFRLPVPSVVLEQEEQGFRRRWLVTIVHTTRPQVFCGDVRPNSPLEEPSRFSGSFAPFVRRADEDEEGNPILNSAEEPFRDLERDDSRDSIICDINLPSINLIQRAAFRDSVNESTWWGFPPRTLKLYRWDWAIEFYGACLAYVPQRFEFHVNEDTWDFEPLDEGYREKLANGDIVEIRDRDGELITEPHLLDGAGAKLGDEAEPVYLNFKVYKRKNFGDIAGLPAALPGVAQTS